MPEWLKQLLKLFGLFGESAGGVGGTPQGASQDAGQPAPAPTPAAFTPPPWFEFMKGIDDDPSILPSPDYDGTKTLADRGWNGMLPTTRDAFNNLKEVVAKQGIDIFLTEGFRPRRRQAYLYSLGREKQADGKWKVVDEKKKVTNSLPGQSNHQSRRAFDVALKDYPRVPDAGTGELPKVNPYDLGVFTKVGAAGKTMQLTWGGDWKKSFPPDGDFPHFEIPA